MGGNRREAGQNDDEQAGGEKELGTFGPGRLGKKARQQKLPGLSGGGSVRVAASYPTAFGFNSRHLHTI